MDSPVHILSVASITFEMNKHADCRGFVTQHQQLTSLILLRLKGSQYLQPGSCGDPEWEPVESPWSLNEMFNNLIRGLCLRVHIILAMQWTIKFLRIYIHFLKIKKLILNGTVQLIRDLNPANHNLISTTTQCPYRSASSSVVGTRLTASSPLSVCLHNTLPRPIQAGIGLLYVTFHTEQLSIKTEFVSFYWIYYPENSPAPSQRSPGPIMSLFSHSLPHLHSSSPLLLRKHLCPQHRFLLRPPCYRQQFSKHTASINFTRCLKLG